MKKFGIIVLVILSFLIFVASSHAVGENEPTQVIKFVWDANPEPEVKGYYIYRSTVSGEYDTKNPINKDIIVGTTYTDVIPTGVKETYYYVVVASNGFVKSDFSNELMTKVNTVKPQPPTTVRRTTFIHINGEEITIQIND